MTESAEPRSILRAIGSPKRLLVVRRASLRSAQRTTANKEAVRLDAQNHAVVATSTPTVDRGQHGRLPSLERLHQALDTGACRSVLPCQTFPHTRVLRCHVTQTSTIAPGGECEVPCCGRHNVEHGKGTPYGARYPNRPSASHPCSSAAKLYSCVEKPGPVANRALFIEDENATAAGWCSRIRQ